MNWASLKALFPSNPRGSEAVNELASAYRNVFRGNATRQDAEIVLADLADFTRFYQALPVGSAGSELAEINGMRIVFGRIFNYLNMTDAEIRALQEAARQETLTNQSGDD